jgi:hypothetical protein
MKHSDKIMPAAAVAAALSSMACCLPLGFAAAAGAAGLSLILPALGQWLLGLSVLFLLLGIYQVYRRRGTCEKRSRASVAAIWLAAALVVTAILFPQTIADYLAGTPTSQTGQSGIADIDAAVFRDKFNQAVDQVRIVLLLSPT